MFRARVFAIDYRLAPEHKYPAALEDALQAYEWLISPTGSFVFFFYSFLKGGKVSPRNLTIGGDSAGGGLAMATLMRLKAQSKPMPESCLLFSPWVHFFISECNNMEGGSHFVQTEHKI